MIKVLIDGKEVLLSEKTRILDIIDNSDKKYIAAKVNNRLRELTYIVSKDSTIELLDLSRHSANEIYSNSLRFLFTMAMQNVYPESNCKLSYSISRSYLAKLVNSKQKFFTQTMMNNIEKEMNRLVSLDLPINRLTVSKEEAIQLYEKLGYKDKIELAAYRPEKIVHLNKCEDFVNYVYGYVVPSTGYLSKFKLTYFDRGILIRSPRSEMNGEIPELDEEIVYSNTLKTAYKWARMIKAENISNINKHTEDEVSKVVFVNMCEARHNADLVKLADEIIRRRNEVRLICIAGPSSSGKTTFSNRLRIQLMTKGITPVKVSIDDYYMDRSLVPVGPDGKVDLEDINIIDIPLLNQHLQELIDGKEVTLPSFDFASGKRLVGKTISVKHNQPIIIEGIHALNDDLTPLIKRENKFKIYIAPHVQVNLDNHTPLSSTNIRLLRRIVRDYKYRGNSAENTLAQWSSVRAGEFKWIYNNQESADYVYNSDLVYEVAVLKKHAVPLLRAIEPESRHYIAANSLLKFLKLYEDIEDELVPCNSLLREFIGGSCFKDV